MAAFHPRLKNEHIQNYEELASYPFGPFGEKCVLYATFFMAVGSKEYFFSICRSLDSSALIFHVPLSNHLFFLFWFFSFFFS
jgi:hypothetical protein